MIFFIADKIHFHLHGEKAQIYFSLLVLSGGGERVERAQQHIHLQEYKNIIDVCECVFGDRCHLKDISGATKYIQSKKLLDMRAT
jgi:hypothetical protein